jgi:uroporphyrinogen-III synthase
MLEKEGAATLRCPMLSIVDAPDAAPVLDWLRDLVQDRFGLVVLLTGEGLRRLIGFADREGLRPAAIASLARTAMLTRGPKPAQALKEIGLTPTHVAEAPTTEGVIATLRKLDLKGRTVGVQLYAPSNPPLMEFLQSAGVVAKPVLPYVYAPAIDAEQVAELIQKLAAGQVDVLVFTSSPQIDRLFEVAREKDLEGTLRQGLERTKIAAIGPIAADNLKRRNAPVHICPDRGFVMKNLVQQIVRQWPPPD